MPLTALFIDWGLTATWPIVGKWALAFYDPVSYGFLSLAVGFLTAVPFLGRTGLKAIVSPGLRGRLFLMGAFGSGLPTLLLLIGVSRTTPANAAIVCQVEVVYSALLAALFLGERITRRQVAGTALVLSGTGLILGKDIGTPHWGGDLILMGTVWMFQVSHIISKRLPREVDHWTIAGARMFYGWLVVLPFFLWVLASGGARLSADPHALGLLGYQSVFLGSLNLWFWYVAIRNLELAKTTAVMLSYPALTMVLSWALGVETLGWHQLAGLALALTGALWITFQMRNGLPAGETAPA